jgi:hypothetical protein
MRRVTQGRLQADEKDPARSRPLESFPPGVDAEPKGNTSESNKTAAICVRRHQPRSVPVPRNSLSVVLFLFWGWDGIGSPPQAGPLASRLTVYANEVTVYANEDCGWAPSTPERHCAITEVGPGAAGVSCVPRKGKGLDAELSHAGSDPSLVRSLGFKWCHLGFAACLPCPGQAGRELLVSLRVPGGHWLPLGILFVCSTGI